MTSQELCLNCGHGFINMNHGLKNNSIQIVLDELYFKGFIHSNCFDILNRLSIYHEVLNSDIPISIRNEVLNK